MKNPAPSRPSGSGSSRRGAPAPGAASPGAAPAAAGAVAPPRRDALTFSAYASLASWGWILYATGAFLPVLRAESGASRTVMGLHSTAISVGALVVAVTMVPVVRALRRRGALTVGCTVLGAGVLLLVSHPSPLVTLPAMLLVGFGGQLTINVSNSMVTAHHGAAAPAALTEANGVGSGIGLLAPLAVGAGAATVVGWRPAAAAVLVPVVVAVLLMRRVPRGTWAVDAEAPPKGSPRGTLGAVFMLTAGAVVVTSAIESTAVGWTADLLAQRAGLSPGTAAGAVSAMVVGITVGRFLLGPLSARLEVGLLFICAVALSVVGWAVVWTATSPGQGFVGVVVMGLGISVHYPLGLALVFGAAEGQLDRASGLVALGTSLITAVAPAVVGVLADRWSTHTAFVVLPLLAVVAATLQVLARRGAVTRTPGPA